MATINWMGEEYQIMDLSNMMAFVIQAEVSRAKANLQSLKTRVSSQRRALELLAAELEAEGTATTLPYNPASLEMMVAEYKQRCEVLGNMIHASLESGLLARLV